MIKIFFVIPIFLSFSFVQAKSIELGRIAIKYDVFRGNKKGIEIICKEIRIKGKRGTRVAFGMNIKQKRWLRRSWKKSSATTLDRNRFTRKNISFFYSYAYLSKNGNTNQKFKAWFHVVDTKNKTLENRYFSFFYKAGYNNIRPAKRKQIAWLKVVPVSGIIGLDFFVAPYMDHNPQRGSYFDFMGKRNAYDGHTGTDFAIPSFQEMDTGVPIVAAADGIVLKIKDGLFDRNIKGSGKPGNFVIIRHDYNRISYYWHFRKNSIIVRPGDIVRAGQQLGLVGSSGNSRWPHLHFEITEDGQIVDPFARRSASRGLGRRRSRWARQPRYAYPMTVVDAGIFSKSSRLPYATIRRTFVRENEIGKMKFWLFVLAQKPGRERTWKLIDPSGRVKKRWKYKLTESYNISKAWWYLSRVKYYPGIWRMQIHHGYKLAADIPFRVYGKNERIRKSAGFKLIGNSIMRPLVEYRDVLKCEVPYSVKFSNRNLIKTAYKYVWYMNRRKIREIVSASRRDYLPMPAGRRYGRATCRVYKK